MTARKFKILVGGQGDPTLRECLALAMAAAATRTDVELVFDPLAAGSYRENASLPYRPLLYCEEKSIESISGCYPAARLFYSCANALWDSKEESLIGFIITRLWPAIGSSSLQVLETSLNAIEEGPHRALTLIANTPTNKETFPSFANILLYCTLIRCPKPLRMAKFPRMQQFIGTFQATFSFVETVKKSLSTILVPLHLDVAMAIAESPKFYVTTAINYTNGPPHMGHAYEAIISDVIARHHRLFGRQTFFLTGTDEHGQKILSAAEKDGTLPLEFCTKFVKLFQELNARLSITNDYFVRTTDEAHHKFAQKLWQKTKEAGDIYLHSYSGWYNVREEAFVTDRAAEETDFKDPGTGVLLQRMEEPSYFFRMSKFHDRLLEHLETNPTFLLPPSRCNEIIARLRAHPLEDLSVSRATFDWGIPIPHDEKHVMYVWFDALSNYLSALDYPDGDIAYLWPSDCQVIGKDIVWFHCVIWPAMLMSAGIPLPKTVFAHGFVSASDGRKMSKSFNNVIDPMKLLDQIPSDVFRYYVMKESRLGADLKFDTEALWELHNADLADTLGNLVHRATSLAHKLCKGVVPAAASGKCTPPFEVAPLIADAERNFQNFATQEALERVLNACRDANKFLTDHAPWAEPDGARAQELVRLLLEAIYVLAHFFFPFTPNASKAIAEKMGTPLTAIGKLSIWYQNLQPGTEIQVGDVLFQKRDKNGKVIAPGTKC